MGRVVEIHAQSGPAGKIDLRNKEQKDRPGIVRGFAENLACENGDAGWRSYIVSATRADDHNRRAGRSVNPAFFLVGQGVAGVLVNQQNECRSGSREVICQEFGRLLRPERGSS